MAKTKAPLMSLGASGQLAKTVVYGSWKAIKTSREYVKPANPRTALQNAHRELYALAVNAFRNYFIVAQARESWNRFATASGGRMSGYNMFVKALVALIPLDPAASCVGYSHPPGANTIRWQMWNIDDGGGGDEAGNFQIWVGDSPTSLLYFEDKPIDVQRVVSSALGVAGDVKYAQLIKNEIPRGGICRHTLVA